MNYSNGYLHIIGDPAALDKHQDEIIRHALRVLHTTCRYADRCSEYFTATRKQPDYLFITFRTAEGAVPLEITRINDVLVDNNEVPEKGPLAAAETLFESSRRLVPQRNRAIRFALLPGAPIQYVEESGLFADIPVVQYTNADPTTGRYAKRRR